MMDGNILATNVAASLEYLLTIETEQRERIAKLKENGFRIVTGGQHDREGGWSISDYLTGERLAHGKLFANFEKAWQDKWWDVDGITREVYESVNRPNPAKLPEDLAEAIHIWVEENPQVARDWLKTLQNKA
jgi:uncharacterized protein YciI